jgi:hypothetical protein
VSDSKAATAIIVLDAIVAFHTYKTFIDPSRKILSFPLDYQPQP